MAVGDYFKYGVVDRGSDESRILNLIFRLRYQVYVREWGFEKPEDHPQGLETDSYEPESVHFYAYYYSEDNVIGTIRLILKSASLFPIENEFDIEPLPVGVSKDSVAEISRLAISKDFRRRAIDKAIFDSDDTGLKEYALLGRDHSEERRKSESDLVRGLYLSIYKYSKQRGITHWYAVMAKGLYMILARWGIRFEQIGPEKDYHGIRAPYLVCIESIEKALALKNPELLQAARARLGNPSS